MKWFANSNTQRAALFVCVLASSTSAGAQQPVAAKKAADTAAKKVQTHSPIEGYLRVLIGRERNAHAKEIAASQEKHAAVELYLRTVIGKERTAHAKEIQAHSVAEQYFRTVIGKEREAHAKEVAELKKRLQKLEGNLKTNAKRSRTKSPSR